MGKHVSGILRARQISFHIQDLAEGNTELFGDLEHAKVLLSLGSELQSRCRKTEHELLGEWIAEVKNELTSSEAGMCTKGKLMEISQEGLLIVNYSSRLVQLLREVRQLTELGVTVPDSIKQAAKDGEQYYRQIHFYSLLDMPNKAINKMKGTLDRGFFPYPYFNTDRFLDPIRGTSGFDSILNQIKAKHIEFKTLFQNTMDMNLLADLPS